MKHKLILLTLAILTLTSCGAKSDTDVVEVEVTPITDMVIEPIAPPIEIVEDELTEPVEEVEKVLYRVTAYCACERCCGKWALNRPIDENGDQIVVGAAGVRLVNEFSCAGTLPFGTQVELDGYGTVEVQDRFANWIVEKYGENVIDVFINDHDKALEFGVKYLEGVIVNDA